jgi:hypothetical protein
MTRTAFAFALLASILLIPQVAEAKYRLPSSSELLGRSSLIVVGEVEAVGERHYRVKVTQQIVGPKKALSGSIQVWRRSRDRRICAPTDPAGIEAGTRWVWILEPSDKQYRSWISAPLPISKNPRTKAEHVSCSRLPVQAEAQTLADFATMIQAYRRCYRIEKRGYATQLGSDAEIAAFKASSPHAAALAGRTAIKKPGSN